MALCIALLVALRSGAQAVPGQQHPNGSQRGSPHLTDDMDDTTNSEAVDREKALRLQNAARQKSMVADTDRLVRLVNELNAEIVRTNPDSLTPAQQRKVAEIEKLARNVKEKMSTSVRGMPAFQISHFPQR